MIYICIATPKEMKLLPFTIPQSVWGQAPRIVITGVGGSNVVRKLRSFAKEFNPQTDYIWNVGYCGARDIKPGTVVQAVACLTYHPAAEFDEPDYKLGHSLDASYPVTCLTAGDFVSDPSSIPYDEWGNSCVVDMELAYLCALFPDRVSSIKVVSDNCNLGEYRQNVEK